MKKRKRRKKVVLTVKERKNKMLKSSEWILLGILYVAVSEIIVNHYNFKWQYLPYAFAVVGVVISKIVFRILRVLSKGTSALLNSLKDL